MTLKHDPFGSELRQILRRGDPLREDEPTADEVARMRRRVLTSASPEKSPSGAWHRPLAAVTAAALIVLAAVGGRWMLRPPSPAPRAETAPTQAAPAQDPGGISHASTSVPGRNERDARAAMQPAARSDVTSRQVQFTTAGGTRIVWVLNPDFALPPEPDQQEEPRWAAE